MNQPDIEGTVKNGNFPGLTHLAIDVGNRDLVDHLTGVISKDGHRVISTPRITGDGYYESIILDPEGNRIEIFSA
jgi:lactoylglutathione lyase